MEEIDGFTHPVGVCTGVVDDEIVVEDFGTVVGLDDVALAEGNVLLRRVDIVDVEVG